MKYSLSSSFRTYMYTIAFICLCGLVWTGYVIYVHFTGKENALISGLFFGAVCSFFLILNLWYLRKLPKSFELKEDLLIVTDAKGVSIEVPLPSVSQFEVGLGHRVLHVGDSKISITQYYCDHTDLFEKLDRYFKRS